MLRRLLRWFLAPRKLRSGDRDARVVLHAEDGYAVWCDTLSHEISGSEVVLHVRPLGAIAATGMTVVDGDGYAVYSREFGFTRGTYPSETLVYRIQCNV